MDFECGICNELLYRANDVTLVGFLEVMARHSRLPEVGPIILHELGYTDGSEENFKSVKKRFRRMLSMAEQPEWMTTAMFQFMRIIATPCGHLFHFWCLEEWKQIRKRYGNFMCPFCRQCCSEDNLSAIRFGPVVRPSDKKRNKILKTDSEFVFAMHTPNIDVLPGGGNNGNGSTRNTFFRNLYLRLRLQITPKENRNPIPNRNQNQIENQNQNGMINWFAPAVNQFRAEVGINLEPRAQARPWNVAETLKYFYKFDILLPILTFFLTAWNILVYVDEKKVDYGMDEENLLNEEYYMDGYYALLIFSACWFSLMMDYTFQSMDRVMVQD